MEDKIKIWSDAKTRYASYVTESGKQIVVASCMATFEQLKLEIKYELAKNEKGE